MDLVITLQELSSLKVGSVSLSEALDLATPSGRALAGMFALVRRVRKGPLPETASKAGIVQARKEGKPLGRLPSTALYLDKIKELFSTGSSMRAIASQ